MKLKACVLALVVLSAGHASVSSAKSESEFDDLHVGIFAERSDIERAGGMMLMGYSKRGYVGLSFSTVKADRPLEASKREQIYPMYIFGGVRFPYSVSPFVGAGVDLGDLILDYGEREEERPLQTDFSVSAGIDWVTRDFRFSLYRKRYSLYFTEYNSTYVKTEYFNVTGISLALKFDL